MGRWIALALASVYGLWLVLAYEVHFLDGVNLLFHEAGHVFFGFAGPTLHFLGGTFGQLFFPIAAGVHFLTRGRPFDATLCGVWLGENFMHIAWYVEDAYSMVLPLVGGEIHDWNWLLTRWGLLHSCEEIARAVHLLGAAIVLGALAAAAALAWREREAEATTPLLET